MAVEFFRWIFLDTLAVKAIMTSLIPWLEVDAFCVSSSPVVRSARDQREKIQGTAAPSCLLHLDCSEATGCSLGPPSGSQATSTCRRKKNKEAEKESMCVTVVTRYVKTSNHVTWHAHKTCTKHKPCT